MAIKTPEQIQQEQQERYSGYIARGASPNTQISATPIATGTQPQTTFSQLAGFGTVQTPFVTDTPGTISNIDLSEAFNPDTIASQNNTIAQYQADIERQNQALTDLDTNFATEFPDLTTFNPQQEYQTLFGASNVPQNQASLQDINTRLANIRQGAFSYQDYINNLIQQQEGRGGFESIVGGRQARLGKELSRRLQPLQRQEALFLEQQKNLQSAIEQEKENILNQITFGQQNFQNIMSQRQEQFGFFKEKKSGIQAQIEATQKALEKQLELAQKRDIDPMDLLKTLIQVPEGISITLPDGSIVTGLKQEDPDVQMFSETDAEGNTTIIGIDKSGSVPKVTFKYDAGQIGKPSEGYIPASTIDVGSTKEEQSTDYRTRVSTLPAGQQESAFAVPQAFLNANSIIALLDKVKTGPFAGLGARGKQLFGTSSSEQNQFIASTTAFTANFIKAISGVQVSDRERKFLMKSLPSVYKQEGVNRDNLKVLTDFLKNKYETQLGIQFEDYPDLLPQLPGSQNPTEPYGQPFSYDPSTSQKGLQKLSLGGKQITVSQQIADRLQRADDEFYRATGKHIQVNQSFRTRQEQERLYKELSKKGARVAPPGKSFHEKGLAIDVSNWKEAEKYLRKYGLKNNLADDRGHFSFGEFS